MRLPGPGEPNIKLPPGDGSERDWLIAHYTESPAPIWDRVRMLGFLPPIHRDGVMALRDASLKAWGKMVNLWWAEGAKLLLAQTSPRYAKGKWLDWWGKKKKRPRIGSESDTDYRARLLASPAIVTPNAIMPVIREMIAAELAPSPPALLEPARDFAFASSVSSGVGSPRCFVQPQTKRLWASGPNTGKRTAGIYVVSVVRRAERWIVLPGNPGSTYKGGFVSSVNANTPSGLPAPTAWLPSTSYPTVGQLVTNGGVVYKCTTPGTSAALPSTGPAGSGVVLDGSVVWTSVIRSFGAFVQSSSANPGQHTYAFVQASRTSLLKKIIFEYESRRGSGVVWRLFVDQALTRSRPPVQ